MIENNNIRLGYACVNMTLTSRPKKLGGRVTTSRTCRKVTWHPTWDLHAIGELAVQNAKDLLHYLKWNEENKIRLFRIGSELVPWHDHFELSDLPQFDDLVYHLRQAGDYAKQHGHRLTTHPGPFHVLGSPNLEVVEKSIIGLERHSELFDLMGFEPSFENPINIHVGGAYGDHESTAVRWIEAWHRLSDNCKARLVLENDDKASMYSVRSLHHLFHRQIGIPITFDYHHHCFHPDGLSEQEALELAGETWPDDIVQYCHYSEGRRIEKCNEIEQLLERNNIDINDIDQWPTFAKRYAEASKIKLQAHSDYIYDFINSYGNRLDIEIEAKAKELALLRYRNIYQYNRKGEMLCNT